ncbi:hypothetical protein DM01DRAFT_1410606 [Hesseltinella vesiculosa]|uniref:RRM domain-containing protein n=1 Tax=Hesseltinella vesiculosa TaxID=101127 RepID=A0A1X2G6V4_9FUNG|nr:hypothetical protein DM01DRAFT_1410606 [Hesseltinella vesiculosa]
MPKSNKTLSISHLSSEITEKTLRDIFSMIASVQSVQLQAQTHSGLVTFDERQGAEQALHTMDGRVIHGQKIHVQWHTKQSMLSMMHSQKYRMLVDGLHVDVTSAMLEKEFAPYKPKHVEMIMDKTTHLPKGHALIEFDDKEMANKAMMAMDGKRLFQGKASSAIRCCWANDHLFPSTSPSSSSTPIPISAVASSPSSNYSTPLASPRFTSLSLTSMASAPPSPRTTSVRVTSANNLSYEDIFAQTPPYNTTVDVFNLPDSVTEQDLVSHFQQYGYVLHIDILDGGRASLQLDTHGNAATAIFALQGFMMDDQPISLAWGQCGDEGPHPTSRGPRKPSVSSVFQQMYHQPTPNVPGYFDMLNMRPPAPVVGSPGASGGKAGEAIHGWHQYNYVHYSAGHQNIR